MSESEINKVLFERIASDIRSKGYSIHTNALPMPLAHELLSVMHQQQFKRAGIGREQDFKRDDVIRNDEIAWITPETGAESDWLAWTAALQQFLNRQLLLGLFSFESHFAHYSAGDFYKRHYDAFKGDANRVLSIVTYLNADWLPEHGGELVLYQNEADVTGMKVLPEMATVVVFLSDEFPHEVLPANQDRYSIAGWFRVNTSSAEKVDPPE